MAASPPRRARRIAAGGAVAALVVASAAAVALRTEPAQADYLNAPDARRALTRVTWMARTDRVVGIVLARSEAVFRMERSGTVRTWIVRPGREAVEAGTEPLTAAYAPVKAADVDLPRLVDRIRADQVGRSCKPTTLKAEIEVTHYPQPVTHVWCLDGARHAWLNRAGDKLADVDPRTAEGLTAGVTDLRRLTGARHVSYLAVRFGGEDAGIDLETPGACGDLAACDAVVASRRIHVESRTPALTTREAPARLNYAEPIDLDTVDVARLHATIERQTQTRKGVDWWRNLTVTLYQRPGHRPTLEFKQGTRVFWTDLDGAETQF